MIGGSHVDNIADYWRGMPYHTRNGCPDTVVLYCNTIHPVSYLISTVKYVTPHLYPPGKYLPLQLPDHAVSLGRSHSDSAVSGTDGMA